MLVLTITSEARLAATAIYFLFRQEMIMHMRPMRDSRTIITIPVTLACQALILTSSTVASVKSHHGSDGTSSPFQFLVVPPRVFRLVSMYTLLLNDDDELSAVYWSSIEVYYPISITLELGSAFSILVISVWRRARTLINPACEILSSRSLIGLNLIRISCVTGM